MKNIQVKNIIILSLLFFLPAVTFAGEIFGTIKKDGKPLAKQEITISQNGVVLATAITDEKGYYSLQVKQVGKCTIALKGYEGATFDVFSTNNSSEYTLTLVKSGDTWLLKKQ